MYNRLAASTMLIAVAIGFFACGKAEKKSGTANAEERKEDAAAAEAEKRKSMK